MALVTRVGDERHSSFGDAIAAVDLPNVSTTASIELVGSESLDDAIAKRIGGVLDEAMVLIEPGALLLGCALASEPNGTGAACQVGVPTAINGLADPSYGVFDQDHRNDAPEWLGGPFADGDQLPRPRQQSVVNHGTHSPKISPQ